MHDPERRALFRAAVVLLAVSVVRWGVEANGTGPDDGAPAEDALASHLAATTAAAEEEDRRSRPLDEGERIDPNVADAVELDRLAGVGPATAAAIVAARDTGATFRVPDDLLVVRGIGPATLERLRPWLELSAVRRPAPSTHGRVGASQRRSSMVGGRTVRGAGGPVVASPVAAVDVNRADVEELQRLPGVGPALARRIVEARRQRPFGSVDELERVTGIGPATVARLRQMAVAGPGR